MQRVLLFTDETNAQLTGLPVGGTGSWMVTFNIRQAFLTTYLNSDDLLAFHLIKYKAMKNLLHRLSDSMIISGILNLIVWRFCLDMVTTYLVDPGLDICYSYDDPGNLPVNHNC